MGDLLWDGADGGAGSLLYVWIIGDLTSSSICPLEGKVVFCGLLGCVLSFGILGGERNERVFGGRERDPSEVWSLARYHVSLWALVSKTFCIYFLGNILHSWNPFF